MTSWDLVSPCHRHEGRASYFSSISNPLKHAFVAMCRRLVCRSRLLHCDVSGSRLLPGEQGSAGMLRLSFQRCPFRCWQGEREEITVKRIGPWAGVGASLNQR